MKYRRQLEIEDVEQLLESVAYWAAGYSYFALFVTGRLQFRCAVSAAQYLEISEADGAFTKLETFQKLAGAEVVGYLSYDLKNDLEDLSSLNPDPLGAPVASLFNPEMWINVEG